MHSTLVRPGGCRVSCRPSGPLLLHFHSRLHNAHVHTQFPRAPPEPGAPNYARDTPFFPVTAFVTARKHTHTHTHWGLSCPRAHLQSLRTLWSSRLATGSAGIGARSFCPGAVLGTRGRWERVWNSIPGPTHLMPGAPPVVMTSDVSRHHPVTLGVGRPGETP